jgi:nucleotide-binding universal stress UspA family protein
LRHHAHSEKGEVLTSDNTLPPIVVGFDGSESSIGAFNWAARQAEMTKSPLVAVTSWHWPMSFGYPMPVPPDYDPSQEAAKILEQAAAKERTEHPGVDIKTTVVEGNPSMALIEVSKDAQLLVVGSRGHREFTGMLLGSVSQHCVTEAHCPVLVFRS